MSMHKTIKLEELAHGAEEVVEKDRSKFVLSVPMYVSADMDGYSSDEAEDRRFVGKFAFAPAKPETLPYRTFAIKTTTVKPKKQGAAAVLKTNIVHQVGSASTTDVQELKAEDLLI